MERITIVCKDDEDGDYTAFVLGEDEDTGFLGATFDEAVGYLIREGLWLAGRLPCVLEDVITLPADEDPVEQIVQAPIAIASPGRYRARFQPQYWKDDYALEVPPEIMPPVEWDCSAFVANPPDEELQTYFASIDVDIEELGSFLDRDDVFCRDPAAPPAVTDYVGPFTITIEHADE